ncbi:MAG: chorismate mutase [Burkholderiales bacterium 35-55-47]|uniref:chorismate mutase n=1 Tax=Limnohabitans sp. TaxID=1907725 RepID=UPI000BDC0CC2|nr:chorismate mutase [Limnohabitans sp.]OYY17272.1 MAG: chorismate mutase [Burkholderiales bacterium 35-55-47]OYZ71871.1 MAG: chorismate mutase [Burkholderiales bacterium 24-55-52]OZA98852.1 MAG: chorismate mutase [Burkholderiales bacterium 39-55-53]HQR87648.1 chorismate mutase [Limnohabitans sp.]HQS28127.1 chorismate mutase [Limnohabitans sp.]
MTQAIYKAKHCASMQEVRQHIDALDDILVPLLVERGAYMTQAARIKANASDVRDEARIEAIVQRVRAAALEQGGHPDVVERIYRDMMEAYIAFEAQEFERLRSTQNGGQL